MYAVTLPLPSAVMARRAASKEPTQQVNFRLKTATVERMERYSERHNLHPTLTQIVEASVAMWLTAAEADVDRHAKDKGGKR